MATFGTTIGSGGLRFYDANHTVAYNYVEGVGGGNFQGPLLLDSGDAEGTSTNLAGHWRVVNALVERNVLIGNPEGIRFGHNYSLAPTGCTVRDNVVAQAGTSAAETVLITPVNTTRTNNTYASTPAAAGLAQGSDTIWRKTGFGPRLTYLQPADVGIAGDPDDLDGTGVLLPGVVPPSGDVGTDSAANKFGWGSPLAASDDFDYTGAPDSTKWSVYNGPGHDNNGQRSPSRVTVTGGKMVLTGVNGSASTAGLAHKLDQQYGRWEIRCRSFYTDDPTAPGDKDGGYHPVLIVWPTSDQWPEDGEYDFLENGEPGQSSAGAFMHYPSTNSADQIDVPNFTVDLREFHNFAFEWSTTGVKGWVDGVEWFSYSGGASGARKNIQDMPSGHLTVQLDAFQATGCIASTFEVEWARVYTLTPAGSPAGPQSVTVTGIGSREAFGFPLVTGGETAPPAGSSPTLLGSAVLGTARLGYTPGSGPPPDPNPSGGQTVTGAGGIAPEFGTEFDLLPSNTLFPSDTLLLPAAGRQFGTPLVSVANGPQTVVAIGVGSGEGFGRPRFTGGGAGGGGVPPVVAPGGVLVPALFAVSTDGSTLTPLPAWSKISVSPVRNSPGALSVEYPAGAPGFTALHDGVSAYPLRALEVRVWLGGSAAGALGGWLVQKSGDDLTPGSTWTFSGHFHEWILSKALIAPQPRTTGNEKGELKFAGANAGLVLATVMDQAQARGALPLVTRDFTSTTDSNGQPWAQQISSLNLAPKTTVAQVADKLVELGLCEYEITAARVWRVFNAGTRGTDRTVGSAPLTFAHARNLAEHSRRESSKDAGTAVLAAGAEGFYEWAESATAKAELGWRAEVGVDAGQVSSQAGVQAAAATQLEIVRNGQAEFTGSIEFTPGSPLPLLDYGVGDWAYTVAGNRRRRLRIAQLGITFQPGRPPAGTVALNDLITDKLAALYRRLNAISSGDAVVGTSAPSTGGVGEDRIPPAAPTGLTATSVAVSVPGETLVQALVRVGWAAVTTNAYPDPAVAGKASAAAQIAARMRGSGDVLEDWTWSGAPTVVTDNNDALLAEYEAAFRPQPAVGWLEAYPASVAGGGTVTDDVASYRVQFAYLGGSVVGGTASFNPDLAVWQEPLGSPTSQLSLEFGEVESARSVGLRVAAIDRAGNQGPWSQVLAIDTADDDTPPPRPSKPIVSVWFETMDIFWDGRGAAGEDMFEAAPDFAGVGGGLEVHVGAGIGFVPDRPVGADGKFNPAASTTYKATLYTSGTWNVTDLTIGVTYYARFVAVDAAGNASEPSDTSDGALPQQLVQIDIGPNAIGRQQIIDGEIVNAKIANLAVNDAKIADLSVGKLTAGTMLAQVVIGGRFSTPTANNNHIELDSAGLRLYQGATVVGRWNVFDASMLMTGQYQSAITGSRFIINPGGSSPDTVRFYPSVGVNYGEITGSLRDGQAAISIYGATSRADQARGEVTAWPLEAALTMGNGDLGTVRSRIAAREIVSLIQSPVLDMNIRHQFPSDQFGYRFSIFHSAVAGAPTVPGNDIASNSLMEFTFKNNTEPQILCSGRNSGLVFGASEIFGTQNNGSTCGFVAAYFNVVSDEQVKTDISDIAAHDLDPLEAVRRARPKKFKFNNRRRPADEVLVPGGTDKYGNPLPPVPLGDYGWDEPEQPDRIGPIAQDLPDLVCTEGPDGLLRVDLAAYAGLLHAALLQLDSRLDVLETAAKPQPPNPPPKEPGKP